MRPPCSGSPALSSAWPREAEGAQVNGAQPMIIFTTLLIAGACMAFAVQQWWRGYHIVAIAFIAFALVMGGVAMEAAKDNRNAEATEVLRQP